ncbi:C-C motif chemokine 3-like 1 [Chaetodon trifascialis]|uniref:C-C motif chemokine 3-like 1 n=1 Tax=Chaetodon trifascialis TaxID=109706 RepID=UPI0039910D81
MQWTVRLTVALLNILWVVFFLTPDPFSVSVQRRSARSSEEETLFHEFCVAPEPHMTSSPHSVNITTNKTNSTDTAAEDPIHLDCCFKFYPRRMNKNLIKSYFLTAARCPKPAVVLVSLKSRHICADPNLSWVKNIMKSVDARSF